MKRVLLTGMSGTGKSTVIAELAARGYKAIDTDDGNWHAWVNVNGEPDRVWREERIRDLLSTEDADVLFVSGTSSNQGKFYRQFDHVVLLSAPMPVLVERLASRTNNPYGKHPDEVARVLGHIATVEPLLRRRATLEVDTSAPLGQVVETILRLVRPSDDHRPDLLIPVQWPRRCSQPGGCTLQGRGARGGGGRRTRRTLVRSSGTSRLATMPAASAGTTAVQPLWCAGAR